MSDSDERMLESDSADVITKTREYYNKGGDKCRLVFFTQNKYLLIMKTGSY
jgi:hypothetical protein